MVRPLDFTTLQDPMLILRAYFIGSRAIRSRTNVEDGYTNWFSESFGSGAEPNSYFQKL